MNDDNLFPGDAARKVKNRERTRNAAIAVAVGVLLLLAKAGIHELTSSARPEESPSAPMWRIRASEATLQFFRSKANTQRVGDEMLRALAERAPDAEFSVTVTGVQDGISLNFTATWLAPGEPPVQRVAGFTSGLAEEGLLLTSVFNLKPRKETISGRASEDFHAWLAANVWSGIRKSARQSSGARRVRTFAAVDCRQQIVARIPEARDDWQSGARLLRTAGDSGELERQSNRVREACSKAGVAKLEEEVRPGSGGAGESRP